MGVTPWAQLVTRGFAKKNLNPWLDEMYLDHPGLWTESMRRKKLIADGSVQPSLLYLLDAPGIQDGWSRPPPHPIIPPLPPMSSYCPQADCPAVSFVYLSRGIRITFLYDLKNNFQHPNSFWQSWMIKENDAACWAWPFIYQYEVLRKRGALNPSHQGTM